MKSTESVSPAEASTGQPDPAPQSSAAPSHHAASLAFLTVGAIGVVFGDIGTSPLYAFREALGQASAGGITRDEILGVLSLALWSLILVVTVKYVLFLMRADNEGEGGVLALLALAGRAIGGRRGIVLALGVIGASLFYGDAILTPALSVLSAAEGLKSVPAIGADLSQNVVLIIATMILILLFLAQSRGTASVSSLFGPICVVWFLAMAAAGIYHIRDHPDVLQALSPHFGIGFLATHGKVGLLVLGAVFLTVTGAEALTADMGHFGRFPIRLGWFLLVFPALALNYFGQGAFALSALDAAQAAGTALQNRDWFFLMVPEAVRVPMVVLALAATVIASQAVITGAFSLSQQAVQLGLMPRMRILQTSAGHAGQIYLPTINWLLLLGVLILVYGFQTSSAMATAYGIAVTGTMLMTTCLAFVVVHRLWGWSLPAAIAFITPFLAIDLVFFGANALRILQGGWVPLLVGAAICLLIHVWVKGKRLIAETESANAAPLADMAKILSLRPPTRVEGTAVFLTANPDIVPGALLHNLKHNQVLHRHNLIVTVRTASTPTVHPDERLKEEELNADFSRITLRYGFTEMPDVPADLRLCQRAEARFAQAMRVSYFIGRNSLRASREEGLPYWQDQILIFLQRNASNPTDFYQIPPDRVVELGVQVVV
jgi:KUP system potassium uptake protein